ncbi:MAG: hypothetical protein HXY18_09685 [Bryobacteraceae bacterium]|nr:hypothetical protein [Bryobacteraceae bacterium]
METTVHLPPPGDPPDPPPRRKSNVLLAALPAFLVTAFMSIWSLLRFAGVEPASGIVPRSESRAAACAQVYGVTLYNSEYYVRESSPGSGFASSKAPRELSTVISGMVENTCDEPLNSVRIKLSVRDVSGARGSGEVTVGKIGPRQAKPFERAWIGQITGYEIVRLE